MSPAGPGPASAGPRRGTRFWAPPPRGHRPRGLLRERSGGQGGHRNHPTRHYANPEPGPGGPTSPLEQACGGGCASEARRTRCGTPDAASPDECSILDDRMILFSGTLRRFRQTRVPCQATTDGHSPACSGAVLRSQLAGGRALQRSSAGADRSSTGLRPTLVM